MFTDEGKQNSLGPLLDDVSLECYVPEPEEPEEPERYTISGYKWEDVDGDGEWDENEDGIPGWTIFLDNEATTTSTTTDETGRYEFVVEAGWYEVYEEQRTDWMQTAPTSTGDSLFSTELIDPEEPSYASCTYHFYNEKSEDLQLSVYDWSYGPFNPESCDFGNQFVGTTTSTSTDTTTPTSNGGGGGSSGTFFGSDFNAPESAQSVLGASTDTVCPFLTEHMQVGWQNNTWEVIKLQLFLKLVMGYDNPVTGFFGEMTDENVKRFQAFFAAEILTPWFEAGVVPHENPTGFVYKTTKWKINDIMCPGFVAQPSLEGETLSENVDID